MDGLKTLLEKHWENLDVKAVEVGVEERNRMTFVRVLERAIEADLQGNIDAVGAEAA